MRTLALAVTALLAVLHLPFPFSSDQALTFVGALAVDRGATLYVDWWDTASREPSGSVSSSAGDHVRCTVAGFFHRPAT